MLKLLGSMVSNSITLATEIEEDLHQTIRFHPGDYSIFKATF
jgi:hypothetical protein